MSLSEQCLLMRNSYSNDYLIFEAILFHCHKLSNPTQHQSTVKISSKYRKCRRSTFQIKFKVSNNLYDYKRENFQY